MFGGERMDGEPKPSILWLQHSIVAVVLQHKTMHREELTASETEKSVRRQVEMKAAKLQHRKTDELEGVHRAKTSPHNSPTKVSPGHGLQWSLI